MPSFPCLSKEPDSLQSCTSYDPNSKVGRSGSARDHSMLKVQKGEVHLIGGFARGSSRGIKHAILQQKVLAKRLELFSRAERLLPRMKRKTLVRAVVSAKAQCSNYPCLPASIPATELIGFPFKILRTPVTIVVI